MVKREPKLPVVIPEKMIRWKATNSRMLNATRRFKKWHTDLEHPLPEGLDTLIRCYETAELLILQMILDAKGKKL